MLYINLGLSRQGVRNMLVSNSIQNSDAHSPPNFVDSYTLQGIVGSQVRSEGRAECRFASIDAQDDSGCRESSCEHEDHNRFGCA
jgi:hypothetical protein